MGLWGCELGPCLSPLGPLHPLSPCVQLQRGIAVAGSQLDTCRQTLELREAAAALAQSVQPLNAAYSRIAAGAVGAAGGRQCAAPWNGWLHCWHHIFGY